MLLTMGVALYALILIFIGFENIQSYFLTLAISSNEMSFWRNFCLGAVFVAGISLYALKGGTVVFLFALVAAKLLLVDLPTIFVGKGSLSKRGFEDRRSAVHETR